MMSEAERFSESPAIRSPTTDVRQGFKKTCNQRWTGKKARVVSKVIDEARAMKKDGCSIRQAGFVAAAALELPDTFVGMEDLELVTVLNPDEVAAVAIEIIPERVVVWIGACVAVRTALGMGTVEVSEVTGDPNDPLIWSIEKFGVNDMYG